MTIAYTLKDVSFAYKDEPVLRVGYLQIGRGEIVGLVGPNGSGKTTLLNVLAFLGIPQQGHVEFFGQEVRNGDNLGIRRQVALLLQNPYLFRETVLSNIVWGLRIRGIRKDEATDTANKALKMVGLPGFGSRHAQSLSGGEAQRVALARCLAINPTVLLLDEPFNHMDRAAVRLTEDLVVRLSRDNGTTVVFTSHAIENLQAVAHRVVHLWQGRVVPAGPENLFRGALREDGLVFDTGRLCVRLEEPAAEGEFIVIDPLRISIRLDGSSPEQPNVFPGKVTGLSDENGRVRVVVDAGERLVVFLQCEDPIIERLKLGTRAMVSLGGRGIAVL